MYGVGWELTSTCYDRDNENGFNNTHMGVVWRCNALSS